jgi:glycosyltransferase involved in cell wall biosynthesis
MIEWGIAVGALSFAVIAVVNALTFLRAQQRTITDDPSVSILIPARNEERTIAECLKSACLQGNLVREILVYDDQSTDSTAVIVQSWMERDKRIKLIHGVALPQSWYGKPHACYRLAEHARGEWLLFIDADVRLHKHAVSKLLATALNYRCSFLSAWPEVEMRTPVELLLMPMLNFYVFTLFPSPLQLLSNAPRYALAHGACILCRRAEYWDVGGHAAVRTDLFEDTALARLWRSHGHRGLCCDGRGIVQVRMYTRLREIWQGFEKNFFPGFRRKWMFFLVLTIHAIFFTAPFVGLLLSPSLPTTIASCAVLFSRVSLAIRFRHSCWSVLFHPLAELMLLALGISSFVRWQGRQGVVWKDRVYRRSTTT